MLAALLCVVLVAALVPTTVFAVTEAGNIEYWENNMPIKFTPLFHQLMGIMTAY